MNGAKESMLPVVSGPQETYPSWTGEGTSFLRPEKDQKEISEHNQNEGAKVSGAFRKDGYRGVPPGQHLRVLQSPGSGWWRGDSGNGLMD